jgi:hypothetical protein
MSVSTAALSCSVGLIPLLQNSFLDSLALLGVDAPRVVTPRQANPVLPSTLVLEAALYQGKATRRPTRHVTAGESDILFRAILASSEVIDEGTFIE